MNGRRAAWSVRVVRVREGMHRHGRGRLRVVSCRTVSCAVATGLPSVLILTPGGGGSSSVCGTGRVAHNTTIACFLEISSGDVAVMCGTIRIRIGCSHCSHVGHAWVVGMEGGLVVDILGLLFEVRSIFLDLQTLAMPAICDHADEAEKQHCANADESTDNSTGVAEETV